MYKCNNCKKIWYEPEQECDFDGVYGVCPYCHSADLDEIVEDDIEICEECGEEFVAEYQDEIHCNHCKEKLGLEL